METVGTLDTLFGGLAKDYLNSGSSRTLFDYAPTENGLVKRAQHLQELSFDRKLIADLLHLENSASGATTATLANIERLRNPKAVMVSCGHQAILMGGPLFVAYKILSAIRYCHWIENNLNIPAIPFFWLAADDDDIAEVTTAYLSSTEKWGFDSGSYQGPTGFLPSPEPSINTPYTFGAQNWGVYHTRLFHTLFGALGLVVANPLSKVIQQLRTPFFASFKNNIEKVRNEVKQLNEQLKEMGFKPQVAYKNEDSFLYELLDNRRKRVTEPTTLNESIALTTALSRLPSLEFSLPLIAEVSGPSEVAYHAQTRPFYEIHERSMPVVLPRFSATLFDARIEPLDAVGLTPSDVITDRLSAENHAAKSFIPSQLSKKLDQLPEAIQELFAPLLEQATEFDGSLRSTLAASSRKAQSVKPYLDRKIMAAARKKLWQHTPELTEALDFLNPGIPQERYFFFLSFTQNPEFLNTLLKQIEPFEFSHSLIRL